MEQEIESIFEEANLCFFNRDYERAQKLYIDIINKKPKHYPTYEKLANIELVNANYAKASEFFSRYLKYNPHNPDIWNQLGNVYFDMENYRGAIKCYRKAIGLDATSYWAYYNIGLAVTEVGKKSERTQNQAKNWFKKAIKINPEYSPALNEMGIYYQSRYDYMRAKDYFLRAIKYNPNYKYPYFNMAKIYKSNNQNDRAKTYLLKAIKIDPAYTSALNYLGTLYYEEESYEGALYYYTASLGVNPQYKFAYYNIGLVFTSMGKYKKGYQAFLRALEIDPKYSLAQQEKDRLEKNYKDQIEFGEELTEADCSSGNYSVDSLDNMLLDKNFAVGGKVEFTEPKGLNKELFVEKFGRNITKLATEGKLFHILGRDREIDNILETLFSLKKNNPLLIGKAGVGKTAIVEGLAQKIASAEVPDFFKGKEIIEINMGILVAGTTFRGDFEKRLKNIVEEVSKNKDLILFIDEIHTLLGAGETGGSNLDAANILKPALAKGDLRCIGATTVEEYLKYFQKDSALDRRFFKIQIEELDKNSTFHILQSLLQKMKEHFKVEIMEEQLWLILELADMELKNRVFPDKAIDILEKSLSRTALQNQKNVSTETIKNVVAEFVGYNVFTTEEERKLHLSGLERYLKKRCLGQDGAVSRITSALITAKSEFSFDPVRPDGVFLFTGPSGVGKTYLAREIAKYLYGKYDKCITINMSEYTEPHSVSKLIGSPPGYVGHDGVSLFHQIMQASPSCILLLDEIEKANPEVLKLFLRIFEEGVINDTSGKAIYFSNATIVMTSNIILTGGTIGFECRQGERDQYAKLKEYFPKEFVNRIDHIVHFDPLEKETAKKIVVDLLIPKAEKVFLRKDMTVNFTDKFIDYIVDLGYDKVKGVRNLERVFEKTVMNTVTNSKLTVGRNRICITVSNNIVTIEGEKNNDQ